MPAIVRLGDRCTGHGGYPSRPNIQASGNVFANGIGVHRVGDAWRYHCNISCHNGTMEQGSNNVFVNGVAVARIGDRVNCGSSAAEGSSNIFCND